jgi:hypothetical protein
MADSQHLLRNTSKYHWGEVCKAGDVDAGRVQPPNHGNTTESSASAADPAQLDLDSTVNLYENSSFDMSIDPGLQNSEFNNIDPFLSNAQIHDIPLLPESQTESSLYPSDSVSQTSNPSTNYRNRSWVYDYFDTIVLDRHYYIPKGSNKQRTDIRRRCKKNCSYSVLDSQQYGTSNLIRYLEYAYRIKKSTSSQQDRPTVIDLLVCGSRPGLSKPKQIPLEKAIINWIAITFQSFDAIEELLFQQIFRSAGGLLLPFFSGDTVHRRILSDFEQCRTSLVEELESNCSTISLALDR